jgi:hypothetical protein
MTKSILFDMEICNIFSENLLQNEENKTGYRMQFRNLFYKISNQNYVNCFHNYPNSLKSTYYLL